MPRLLAGESMVLPPIRKHWVVLARGLFWPAVLAVALLAVAIAPLGIPAAARVALTLIGLSTPLAIGWYSWATWHAATLTVTTQRVILEHGLVARSSTVIPLLRVQDVSTQQDVLGRILNYGSVVIDTAGAAQTELFTYVSRPELLRDQVFMLADRMHRPQGGGL